MRSLLTRVQSLIKRAAVTLSLSDDKDSGVVQVSYFGKTGKTEVCSPYGLSVRLPTGTQTILFSVQAQENNRVCIGYSQKDRFKDLEEGEVVVGNPETKSFIKFDKDGNITIDSKTKLVINVVGDVDITTSGKVDLTSTGNVDVDAPQVNLGTGGAAIARVGDDVNLTTGKIITGGNNTSA